MKSKLGGERRRMMQVSGVVGVLEGGDCEMIVGDGG